MTASEGESDVAQVSSSVQILDDSDEFRDPRPDSAQLERLATRSGGEILGGPDDLARLLARSTRAAARSASTRVPLWDSPAVLALIFVPLAAEWVIRRRKGLV